MKKILQALYSVYVMLIFLVMLFPSFPFWVVIYFFPLKTRDKITYYLLRFYANFWCYTTGIIPRIYHRDKINLEKNYIITANHSNYWDPVQMYTALPIYFKGVGKIEINKAPLFGLLYKMAVIVVDRSSASKSAATYRNMVRYLNDKWSVLIFPEGTFPNNIQSSMYAFKKGAFALAQKQQKEILPLLFVDATDRMPPNHFFRFSPGYLTTVFLPPISYNKFSEEFEFRKFTQEYMQACLDYCRANNSKDVFTFATTYLANINNTN